MTDNPIFACEGCAWTAMKDGLREDFADTAAVFLCGHCSKIHLNLGHNASQTGLLIELTREAAHEIAKRLLDPQRLEPSNTPETKDTLQ